MRHVRVNVHPASVVFYRVVVERYLRPEPEHLRLDQLRVDDAQRAFAGIRRGLDGHGHPVSPTHDSCGRKVATSVELSGVRSSARPRSGCLGRSLAVRPADILLTSGQRP